MKEIQLELLKRDVFKRVNLSTFEACEKEIECCIRIVNKMSYIARNYGMLALKKFFNEIDNLSLKDFLSEIIDGNDLGDYVSLMFYMDSKKRSKEETLMFLMYLLGAMLIEEGASIDAIRSAYKSVMHPKCRHIVQAPEFTLNYVEMMLNRGVIGELFSFVETPDDFSDMIENAVSLPNCLNEPKYADAMFKALAFSTRKALKRVFCSMSLENIVDMCNRKSIEYVFKKESDEAKDLLIKETSAFFIMNTHNIHGFETLVAVPV